MDVPQHPMTYGVCTDPVCRIVTRGRLQQQTSMLTTHWTTSLKPMAQPTISRCECTRCFDTACSLGQR